MPESLMSTTTARFDARAHGRYIRYSFVAGGRTFTAIGWVGERPIEWVESGHQLLVFYDSRDPSISLLEVTGMETGCNDAFAGAAFALLSAGLLGLAARGFSAWKGRREPPSKAPAAVVAAIELQSVTALVTAASLFLALEKTGLFRYPVNLAVGAVASALPVLWSLVASRVMLRPGVGGWLVSVLGTLASGAFVVRSAPSAAPTAIAVIVFVVPAAILLSPRVARSYLSPDKHG
jgi:hypothetical protein